MTKRNSNKRRQSYTVTVSFYGAQAAALREHAQLLGQTPTAVASNVLGSAGIGTVATGG